MAAIAGLLFAAAGNAQGIPVVDASAIAAAQQNLQMLQQQFQQLQSLMTTAQGLAKSVGQNGPLSTAMPQILSQSGLDQFASAAASGIAGLNNGSSLQSLLARIRQQKGLAGSAQTPDFSSFASARQWVDSALATPPSATATAQGLARQARGMVAGEAAANGYALALTARQQISAMSDQTQSLADQIANASTLREDMAANTAVMLAIHDEMAEIEALLASLLAVQSTGQMADTDMQAGAQQTDTGSP